MNVKEIIKLGISLLVFCAVAALALAFTNELTKDKIAAQRAAKELAAKQAVLADAKDFQDVSPETLAKLQAENGIIAQVSKGIDDAGNTVGYVVKSLPMGFGGEMTVITGLKSDGVITGVRVAKHAESPGLGSKSQEPAFYTQYDGKLAAEVTVTKGTPKEQEIVAISSSTITSKAVTRGVNAAAVALTVGE